MADFDIIESDIFSAQVDAIVIPANIKPGEKVLSGLNKQAYKKAGKEKMLKAREQFGEMHIAQCEITDGFRILKKVIHVVTPSYTIKDSEYWLNKCYENALECARKNKIQSIAFPLLSSGNMGFPQDEALSIARSVLENRTLTKGLIQIYLVLYNRKDTKQSIVKDVLDSDYMKYDREFLKEAECIADVEMQDQAKYIHKAYKAMMEDEKAWEDFKKEREEFKMLHSDLSDTVFSRDVFMDYINGCYKSKNNDINTQSDLARKSGINPSFLSHIYNGDKAVPHDKAVKLALCMELKPYDFKRFIFATGSKFPIDTNERIIWECVKQGIYDRSEIEKQQKKLAKAIEHER